jgi:uncharacterized low-complexity protein
MKTNTTRPLAAAICVGFLATAILPVAAATQNPFATTILEGGYQLAAADKAGEGKCGEGKCGGKNKAGHEGKCGEGKCVGEKSTT